MSAGAVARLILAIAALRRACHRARTVTGDHQQKIAQIRRVKPQSPSCGPSQTATQRYHATKTHSRSSYR